MIVYLEAKVLDKVGDTGLVVGLEAGSGIDDQGDGCGGGVLVQGSNLDAVVGLGDGGGVTGLEDGGDQVQGLASRGDGEHDAEGGDVRNREPMVMGMKAERDDLFNPNRKHRRMASKIREGRRAQEIRLEVLR